MDATLAKIQDRQLKRKAAAIEPISVPATVAAIPTLEWQPAAGESPAEREKREKKEKRARIMAEVIPEWKPAAGESPAEREKREKREKRAGKVGVSFDSNPMGPSGSHYVPPPSEFALPDQQAQFDQSFQPGANSSTGSIHPSRIQAAPTAFKAKQEKDPNKEKTASKKRYLKKKKERSKGKKAGEPDLPNLRAKKFKSANGDGVLIEGAEPDSDESSEDEEEEKQKLEAIQKKKNDILKKKVDRKLKRDEKKLEAKKVKAAGGVPIAIIPRILPSAQPPTILTASPTAATSIIPAEPTAAELELQVIEEAKIARKAAKRQKRTDRRLPSPPRTLIPTAHVEVIRSPTPEVDIPPIPQAELAPLLRLPGATRPAPPSAKTLSALNVHESVRDKMIIDPEFKLKLGKDGLELSERAIKRLAEMGVSDAFAGQLRFLS